MKNEVKLENRVVTTKKGLQDQRLSMLIPVKSWTDPIS
jgi:hypothetical protein